MKTVSHSKKSIRPWRVAIIGSGPAAFYAAKELLRQESFLFEVDLFERLPTPYGLVRGGVAPDHPHIKAVSKIYDRIAHLPHFHFLGNVTFGKDINKEELFQLFDAIIYAVGCQSDRHLDIPGESFQGSHSATDFVGWYNGHPDYRDHTFDLSARRIAIIGMGNVALDVARILAHSPEELSHTDIADYAQEALQHSMVEDIYLIGRRGPVQAAFTPIEVRELLALKVTEPFVDSKELSLEAASQNELDHAQRHVQQNLEILKIISQHSGSEKKRHMHLMFKRSPVKIYGNLGKVSGLELVKNQLSQDKEGNIKAQPTNTFERLNVELVFRSIGYQGVPLKGVPFDPKKGIIPNKQGRVIDQKTQSPLFLINNDNYEYCSFLISQ